MAESYVERLEREHSSLPEKELECWLNRAFYAEKKAEALKLCVQKCRERAESISICCEGNDKGKCDGSKNGVENALVMLLDKEEEYKKQICELQGISNEIEAAIRMLNNNDLETVLIYRYILFRSIEETAEAMHYSVRSVNRKHYEAIKKLAHFGTLWHTLALNGTKECAKMIS
jgi:DNA-directed RNA polymerase specialized sigma subunit